MEKPFIAIPLGDPAGIGPEIVLKTLADPETAAIARCVVVGDAKVLKNAMTFPNVPAMEIKVITEPEEGDYSEGVLNLIDLDNVDMEKAICCTLPPAPACHGRQTYPPPADESLHPSSHPQAPAGRAAYGYRNSLCCAPKRRPVPPLARTAFS